MQAPDIDAAALHALPNETKEALLQRLLEQKLRTFATQVSSFLVASDCPALLKLIKRCNAGWCSFQSCDGLNKTPRLHLLAIRQVSTEHCAKPAGEGGQEPAGVELASQVCCQRASAVWSRAHSHPGSAGV